jgi:hypothetical protein
MQLQSPEEGSQVDLLELTKSMQEVLRVTGCHGEFKFLPYCLFSTQFSSFVPLGWVVTSEQQGGCGYVEWHDHPLPKFFTELVGDLQDEVWRLRGEGNVSTWSEDHSGRDRWHGS